MKFKKAIAALAAVLVAITSLVTFEHANAARTPDMMFVDLLYLQPDVPDSQVEEYFDRISPIVAKHGLSRVGSFKVTQKMRGSIEPNFVNLWVVRGPETFEGIFNDEEYKKHMPFRNSTFDMGKAEMFMLAPTWASVKFPKAK